ncbi:MAG: hypothetical protein Q4D26_04360 [Clostridia bacterium]|nr:hypothetical protein [Clostridia bacterium]
MKKILIPLIIIVIIFTANNFYRKINLINKEENSLYEFNPDPKLDQYLDKDKVIKTIKSNPIGAAGPKLVYANDKYAVVLNYNGILIYSLLNNEVIGGIDNVSLGMNKIQGDDYTLIDGNDKFIFIHNFSEKNNGYIYSLKTNEMAKAENINELCFYNTNKVSDENLAKISSNYINDNKDFSVYQTKNEIVVLEYDYQSFDSWKILTISNKQL